MSSDWKLWLDDERYPPIDDITWKIARNYSDARWYIETYGLPSVISFDHDLGDNKLTGMDFTKWLCNHIMDNDIAYNGMKYYVHSMNPVGAQNIQSYMDNFTKHYWA